jgi:hypothetical protein
MEPNEKPPGTNDSEKGLRDSAVSEEGVLETSREERKLLLKLDAIILPLTALLYVSSCSVVTICMYH